MTPGSLIRILVAVAALGGAGGGAGACAAQPVQAGDAYYKAAQAQLAAAKAEPPPLRRARNVIIFIGDGMGVSTLAAARDLAGQKAGVDGASHRLSFERLPHTALSRTFSHDDLVTDSAAGATALLSGVKTRNEVVGLDGRARRADCASARDARAESLGEIAHARGLAVGVVSDARLTDATPAAMYGHSPVRYWENDAKLPAAAALLGCKDLARQLVDAMSAGTIDVALGGGRANFLPAEAGGARADRQDLARRWAEAAPGRRLATTAAELAQISGLSQATEPQVLGLFTPDNFPYTADRPAGEAAPPTLVQMTEAAIDLLSRRPEGYVLLVEGGLIDKAHHVNDAGRALGEVLELSDAVEAALKKIDLTETLVVVTADHSHGLTLSAPADRDAPILGPAMHDGRTVPDKDGKPYAILNYATGPGGPNRALVPLKDAEHTGEDVAVFAAGPGADLVRGSVDSTYVFQVMLEALQRP